MFELRHKFNGVVEICVTRMCTCYGGNGSCVADRRNARRTIHGHLLIVEYVICIFNTDLRRSRPKVEAYNMKWNIIKYRIFNLCIATNNEFISVLWSQELDRLEKIRWNRYISIARTNLQRTDIWRYLIVSEKAEWCRLVCDVMKLVTVGKNVGLQCSKST